MRSWKALGNQIGVFVFGNDKGIKENTHSMGIRHYPDVRCNEKGTPLISSMLEIGRKESSESLQKGEGFRTDLVYDRGVYHYSKEEVE